jgi:hypothetical protein
VQSADIADGTVQLNDLSGVLQAKVNDVAGGLIDTAQLANGSVTNPKLAANSVTSSKVAPNMLGSGDLGAASVRTSEVASNSLGSGDIATGAITGAELGDNTVQGDEVQNGSLNAADVGEFSGSANRSFPAIANSSCGFVFIDPIPGAGSVDGRVAMVTPGPGFGGDVSFHVEAEGPQLRLKACNSSGGAVDPDGAGTNYNYIVFG